MQNIFRRYTLRNYCTLSPLSSASQQSDFVDIYQAYIVPRITAKMLGSVTRNLLRQSNRVANKRLSSHFVRPDLNDAPVPSGSWQARYEANNKKYNMHLVFGVTFFLGSIIAIYQSNFFENRIFFSPKVPQE